MDQIRAEGRVEIEALEESRQALLRDGEAAAQKAESYSERCCCVEKELDDAHDELSRTREELDTARQQLERPQSDPGAGGEAHEKSLQERSELEQALRTVELALEEAREEKQEAHETAAIAMEGMRQALFYT